MDHATSPPNDGGGIDHDNSDSDPNSNSNSNNNKNNPKNVSIRTSSTISANSTTESAHHDPLETSVTSTDSLANLLQLQQGNTKYDDLDDKQLEEFAKAASPKVSELLNEQALALDDLMHTPGWNSSSSDDDDYDDDGDISDDDYVGKPLFDLRKTTPTAGRKGNKTPTRRSTRSKTKKQRSRRSQDDEDSMNEEWNQLEAAQLNLKDELEAATNGFAQMLYGNEDNGDVESGDEHYRSYSQNIIEEKEEEATMNNAEYSEEWRDDIHQYYTANNNNQSNGNGGTATTILSPPPQSNGIGGNTTYETLSPLPSRPNHSYTLADHATTLDVTRPASDRGLYIKPLLSRNELETLGVVTMPSWITRPSGEVSSRGRERYVRRILDCCVEYVEPPKSKHLRRLFSGWNPGPGERRAEDDRGESSGRVMAYSPPKTQSNEDADSDFDDEGADQNDFVDVDGSFTYDGTMRRPMEPLPVRTITVRIRPDVLCGAVMDALTVSVERVGGEMTKRQGGHLRAVLPGRKMRVWLPGEWEREYNTKKQNNDVDIGENTVGESPSHHQDGFSQSPHCHSPNDDAASVSSGLSAMLSPVLGGSSKPKGPSYDILPPYIVDAQLVTKKVGKECQRLVLIRIYRMQDVARARSFYGRCEEEEEALDVIAPLDFTGPLQGDSCEAGLMTDPLIESIRSLKSLQEASALVQRIKAVGGSGFAINPPSQPMMNDDSDTATVASNSSTKSYFKSFGDAIVSPMRYLGSGGSSRSIGKVTSSKPSNFSSAYPTVMELMSADLLRKHVPFPSVGCSKSAMTAAKKKSHGIFPSLSMEDAPYVKSSWLFLRDCCEELDRRCLAYSTLGIQPIFQFPALRTLDAHFISQIKAFCRESMIVSLVKTASELEIYAREVEVSCGNVDQLLRPTFEMYELKPPQLPVPVPLTAYPLDFRAPEEISPPWGPEVVSALDKITSSEFTNNSPSKDKANKNDDNTQQPIPLSSFERSEKAISSIVLAFQQQNDVEQGARLGRKNMQVMDRLAKMQAHKRNSFAKIQHSYGSNLLATKAADEFHLLRQKCSNVGSLTDVINAVPDTEVPLLICNVLVGNAGGTCHVTHSHVLFNTQLVPILGGSRIHLFSIQDVELTINAPSKSVLSPLPASISFTTSVFGRGRKSNTREEVYNFIPSIGARRFAKFLEVLRDVALEDPNSLKFSDKGGLIYLAD